MRVEGVLGGHAPAHDGVEEGFPLASVETQHLGKKKKTSIRTRDTVKLFILISSEHYTYTHIKPALKKRLIQLST